MFFSRLVRCVCGIGALLSLQDSRADTVLVGHRGGDSRYVPENTLEVVTDSFNRGTWGHEIDVRKTTDGSLMLMHDGSVDRTTNGSGGFDSYTTAQLRALDAGSWKGAAFRGFKIPFLSEVLTAIKGNGTRAYLDLKGSITPVDIQNLVTNVGFDSSHLTFLTYSNSQTTNFHAQFPSAEVFRSMWGIEYTGAAVDSQLAALALLGVSGVTIRDIHFTPQYVNAIHAAGMKVALVGFWAPSKQKVEDYISNDVDELWLDDLRSNLGSYNDGDGVLSIPAPPLFEITSFEVNLVTGDVSIVWNSIAGENYRLESSANLREWNVVEESIAGSDLSSSYIHSGGVLGMLKSLFYRVVLLES